MGKTPYLVSKGIYDYRFEILLLSLFLTIGKSILTPLLPYKIIPSLITALNIFAGINLFKKTAKPFWAVSLLAFTYISTIFLEQIFTTLRWRTIELFTSALFSIIVSLKLFHEIIAPKIVTKGLVIASFCGLIVICRIGFTAFLVCELLAPNSFTNLAPSGHGIVDDLMYLSFITILTVGYGDIVPTTLIAKKLAILFSLTGHFYTTVIVAIIIGKYINREKDSHKNG